MRQGVCLFACLFCVSLVFPADFDLAVVEVLPKRLWIRHADKLSSALPGNVGRGKSNTARGSMVCYLWDCAGRAAPGGQPSVGWISASRGEKGLEAARI